MNGDQWGEACEGGGPGKALGRWRMDRDPNEAKERSDPGGPRQTAWQWQANSPRKEELGVWGGVGGPGQREGLHFSLGGQALF